MRTLRVLVSAPPAADHPAPWALVDERGALLAQGEDVPARWPAAERREAVLAAIAARVLALDLPPLPPARVAAAAAYALEERLATPMDASLVVAGPQAPDGRVETVVVARSLARALLAHQPAFDGIVAEARLVPAPPADAWRWCASAAHGVVVTPGGDAFSVSRPDGPALPGELRFALESAARSGRAPLRVLASVPQALAQRDAWTRASGVPFEPGPEWHWACAEQAAPDLRPAFAAQLAPTPPPARKTSFALALGLLAAAGVLHAVAMAGTWATHKVALARTQAALGDAARSAGATDPADLARRHAAVRHRAGASVASDAWPLLAHAAPALASLPAGMLRSAHYGGGAWTLELAPLDADAVAALEARLALARLAAVSAKSAGGLRVRLESTP